MHVTTEPPAFHSAYTGAWLWIGQCFFQPIEETVRTDDPWLLLASPKASLLQQPLVHLQSIQFLCYTDVRGSFVFLNF